ncbi:MAG: glycosyl hydrolase family 28-related protein, partial [Chitinophagales bacterium]
MRLPLLSVLLVIILHANSQTLDISRSVNWQQSGMNADCYVPTALINFAETGGVGDGVTSNDAAMSAVLSSITASYTVVYFPPGNYVFQNPIDLKSNMLLKGAGATQTIFTFNLSAEDDAIKIKGSESATTVSLVSDAAKGVFSFPVTDASSYAVGNYIKLFEEDDMLVTSSWGLYTTGQIFQIESISGNT